MKRKKMVDVPSKIQGTKPEENTNSAAKRKRAAEKVEEEAKRWFGWEESPWLRGDVVEEQMSWGYTWLPIWDVEFVASAYTALFSDVVWDEDIWNLRSIKEIPDP